MKCTTYFCQWELSAFFSDPGNRNST